MTGAGEENGHAVFNDPPPGQPRPLDPSMQEAANADYSCCCVVMLGSVVAWAVVGGWIAWRLLR